MDMIDGWVYVGIYSECNLKRKMKVKRESNGNDICLDVFFLSSLWFRSGYREWKTSRLLLLLLLAIKDKKC